MKMRNESTMYIFHDAYVDAEPMLEQKLTYTNHKDHKTRPLLLYVCNRDKSLF